MSKSHLNPSPYGTIGPFFPFGFCDGCEDLTKFEGKKAGGQQIIIGGTMVEEGGSPVLNAVVEIWQPDSKGIFRHPLDPRFASADPGFFGWGRARTDREGRYQFRTVLPGAPTATGGTPRCPHINVMILAIGLTRRLVTTMFFPGGPQPVRDPVLDCVPEALKSRLFPLRDAALDADGLPGYRFDLVLRGAGETPFFLD